MHYDFIAIPESAVPRAVEPQWQHLVDTYVSECNKTASMWRAVSDECLDFRPQERVNTIRTIFVHQLLSERRFFGEFVATTEPPVDQLLPPGESPMVSAYLEKYIWLCTARLPQFAAGTSEWWLEPRPF